MIIGTRADACAHQSGPLLLRGKIHRHPNQSWAATTTVISSRRVWEANDGIDSRRPADAEDPACTVRFANRNVLEWMPPSALPNAPRPTPSARTIGRLADRRSG